MLWYCQDTDQVYTKNLQVYSSHNAVPVREDGLWTLQAFWPPFWQGAFVLLLTFGNCVGSSDSSVGSFDSSSCFVERLYRSCIPSCRRPHVKKLPGKKQCFQMFSGHQNQFKQCRMISIDILQEVTESHFFDIICHIYVVQRFFSSVFLQCKRQLQLPDTSAETTGQANRPVVDDQFWSLRWVK